MLVRFHVCDMPCGIRHLLENEGLSVYLLPPITEDECTCVLYMQKMAKSMEKREFAAL
jgi:hypothetical protein